MYNEILLLDFNCLFSIKFPPNIINKIIFALNDYPVIIVIGDTLIIRADFL